jgi:hypothetical protein
MRRRESFRAAGRAQNGVVPTSPGPGVVRERDLYALLGVAPDATTEEIGAAFRARAKELHPDRTSDPEATEDFKELSRAYVTLTRPRSRAAYDARLTSAATRARSAAKPPAPTPRRPEILSTPGRARGAIWGGIGCILAGLAIAPVLLGIDSGPDTVGRDVTLWIVVAKLVICGAILVGFGWWRLATLRGPRSTPTGR